MMMTADEPDMRYQEECAEAVRDLGDSLKMTETFLDRYMALAREIAEDESCTLRGELHAAIIRLFDNITLPTIDQLMERAIRSGAKLKFPD